MGVGVVGSIPQKKSHKLFYPNRNPRKKWRGGGVRGVCIPVPTQFKATQLVVAQAVWATQRSDPCFTYFFNHQNNIILLLDNTALFLLGNITLYRLVIYLKEKKENNIERKESLRGESLFRESNV
jgi:hypothetical protein